MIEILPMSDRDQERLLLAEAAVTGPKVRVLAMMERGNMLGWAAVELKEGALRICALNAQGYHFSRKPQGEEIFILDSLMRSAASYGENFGADRIETSFPDFFDFFKARGFEVDGTHAFTPMSTIVKYEFH